MRPTSPLKQADRRKLRPRAGRPQQSQTQTREQVEWASGKMIGGQTNRAMRHPQRVSRGYVLARVVGGSLTSAHTCDVMGGMLRKRSPRLAAAFVVTISAGCGGSGAKPPEHEATPTNPPSKEATPTNPPRTKDEHVLEPTKPDSPNNPNWVPNIGAVQESFIRGKDGKCYIRHPANPPFMEPVDCETQKPIQAPEEAPPADTKPPTPAAFDDSALPEAPQGWTVRETSPGHCRAYASTSCSPGKRCNPPPPKDVRCSSSNLAVPKKSP